MAMSPLQPNPTLADSEFEWSRLKGFFQRVLGSLSGHSQELLSFDEVREKLRLGGPIYRGVQDVPLDQIVGSVDRYKDFDRRFMPRQSHSEQKWQRINRAWYQEENLPPVLLYQVGEVFFVIDGHHRVSVARSHGQPTIEAEVRECQARVPVTPEIEPESLERLGERVDFLERTRIDVLRPDSHIETTLLGGYDRLLEHIAVHRYYMGLEQGREIPEDEAVMHWHDSLYAPVVDAVEGSDVLAEFPGRTPTDLYLWVMDHLHYLRSRAGGDHFDPLGAAADFVEDVTGSEADEHPGG
jgi:hypothetical protein